MIWALWVLIAIVVVGFCVRWMMRFTFDFRRRFDMWFNPALTAMSRKYDIHTRTVEKLIEAYEARRRCGRPGWDQHVMKLGLAISGGLRWMREVAISRNPGLDPTDPDFLAMGSLFLEEVEKEREVLSKVVDGWLIRRRDI